jgi:hypothetical protein
MFRIALKDTNTVTVLNQPRYEVAHLLKVGGILGLMFTWVRKVHIPVVHDSKTHLPRSACSVGALREKVRWQAECQVREHRISATIEAKFRDSVLGKLISKAPIVG